MCVLTRRVFPPCVLVPFPCRVPANAVTALMLRVEWNGLVQAHHIHGMGASTAGERCRSVYVDLRMNATVPCGYVSRRPFRAPALRGGFA